MKDRMMMDKRNSGKEHIWLMLLALSFSNFMAYGGYILSLTLAAYLILHIRNFYMNFEMLLLCLFSMLFTLFYGYHFGFTVPSVINSLFMPWAAYFMGQDLIGRWRQEEDALLRIILSIALGFFLHGLLNLGYTLYHSYSDPSLARLAYDIWKRNRLSVTTNGAYFTMALGVAFGLFHRTGGKKHRKLAVICILAGCYHTVLLGYRTGIVIIAVLAAVSVLLYIISAKGQPEKIWGLILAVMCLTAVSALLWNTDAAGLRTRITHSLLYQRLMAPSAAHSDSRLLIWKSFFSQWLSYPFGGAAFRLYREQRYVHHILLDIYYTAGVFPALALGGFFVVCIYKLAVYLYCGALRGREDLSVVLCLYIAVLLNCMVEPIWDADPYFMIGFFLITGAVSASLGSSTGGEGGNGLPPIREAPNAEVFSGP